jgi:hypothetical protein
MHARQTGGRPCASVSLDEAVCAFVAGTSGEVRGSREDGGCVGQQELVAGRVRIAGCSLNAQSVEGRLREEGRRASAVVEGQGLLNQEHWLGKPLCAS